MRASATSRISSAHLPAAQKPDTNKADEASPFALLVQQAAPKDAGKPLHQDAHDDKPAHVRHHAKKDADTTAVAKPVQTAAQTSNKTPNKDIQSSSNKPADDKQTAKTDEKPVAVIPDDAKPAAQAAVTAKAAEKSDDKIVPAKQDDGDQPQAAAAQDQLPQPQPVAAQIQPAAALIQPAATANDDSGDAEQTVAENQNIKAPQNAPTAPAQDQTQDVQAGQAPAAKPAAKSAKTDGARTDAKTDAKTGAKPGDINTDKDSNAEPAAAANTADTKAATANAALNDKAAAVHDMAASRPGDTNPAAVNSLTAPQAQQPAQNPQVTQHVQVSAQSAPNLPALAVQIAAKSQSGVKQFDIRLDPPELGRVEVRLSIDTTGKASAHLSADQPQTLDLLQKDAPALTRALREAGLDVSQDGLNFSLRHQGGQDANANNGGNRGTGRSFNLAATTSIDATATSAAYRSVADGRLDIRV